KYSEEIQLKVLIGGRTVLLERDGSPVTLNLPVDVIDKLITKRDKKRRVLITERLPAYVGEYAKKDTSSYGKRAGLQLMDKIIAVNGQPVEFLDQINTIAANYKNKEVSLSVLRNTDTLSLVSKVSENGLVGIALLSDEVYDSL